MRGLRAENQNPTEISSEVSSTSSFKGELACSKKDSFHPKVCIYSGDLINQKRHPFLCVFLSLLNLQRLPCFSPTRKAPSLNCHSPRLHQNIALSSILPNLKSIHTLSLSIIELFPFNQVNMQPTSIRYTLYFPLN